MNNKIKEIKTRIDAGQGWPGWCPARSNLDHENECPLCLMYTNAPADIAWLLDEVEALRSKLRSLGQQWGDPSIPEDVPCVFDEGCICDAKHIDFCICEYGEFDDEE